MTKEMIIVHCSDTYASMDIGVKEIREWHLARGWRDIGYALVIRRDGTVERGRDLDQDDDIFDEVGAHARGFNRQSIGICLVGGKSDHCGPEFNFTRAQMDALETTLTWIRARFPGIAVIGHRDVPGAHKACPSFDVGAWWYNQPQP